MQFIPKQKLSKKMQRELNRAKRKTWGALNPATRKPTNPKAYKRQKVQKGDDYTLHFEPSVLEYILFFLRSKLTLPSMLIFLQSNVVGILPL